MVKAGQKQQYFSLFKKIKLLVLSGIDVNRTFLWPFNILRKVHAWEKSGSQVMAKNGSQPFFNYQYFTNRLISDIDFWSVERHE